jgi:hypothetical protein
LLVAVVVQVQLVESVQLQAVTAQLATQMVQQPQLTLVLVAVAAAVQLQAVALAVVTAVLE